MLRVPLLRAVFAAAILSAAATASAEIVVFTSGRTTSVKSHREQGDRLVLVLAGGGEVLCARALVARILPDEMPAFDESLKDENAPALPSAYQELIEDAASRHGVSARLVKALIQVESAFQAQARSRKGAMGLMQLMPDTARRFSVTNPYDPRSNIEAGTKYLKALLDRFDVPALALAAYNAGENAVERFGGIPPYAETRSYVQAVLRLAGLSAAR